jgi:signal transduction histidine kinase
MRAQPGGVAMTPRRVLPGLRTHDAFHDVFQRWRGFGSIFRPLARSKAPVAPGTDLHGRLAEAGQQLQLATAEVAQLKLAAEGVRARQMEFLAFVAHELRHPLAPIRTAAAVLNHGRPQDVVPMRTIIERQIAQMSRMIDDLLDVSRASTGKLRLIPGHVRVDDVVAHASECVAPAINRRGQRLEVIGLDDAGDLDGDLTRLIQVLSNLLDNASKYSPDGQTIRLTVQSLEHSVELSVVDNGIGMSIKALKNIFDPFAQELHAVGFNATGLGIGLAVVRDVVEAHGGRVTASSAGLGHGSRFVVTLPRNSAIVAPRT